MATLGSVPRVEASIAARALLCGYWPSFLRPGPGESPRERLVAALAGGRFAAAVVGPLASLEPEGYAQGFPRVRFVLVGGGPQPRQLSNVVTLAFDGTEACRLAGEASRAALVAEGGRGRIGILSDLAASNLDAEARSFLEGAAESGPGAGQGSGEVLVRTIEQPLDEAKVKAAVAAMRGAGVEVLLLRVPGWEAACLAALRDGGGSAVLSGWASSRAMPAQVFLSVEEMTLEGISLALGKREAAAGVVAGPVRVVCGKARPVPAPFTRRIVCR